MQSVNKLHPDEIIIFFRDKAHVAKIGHNNILHFFGSSLKNRQKVDPARAMLKEHLSGYGLRVLWLLIKLDGILRKHCKRQY
jgi:hypothetical protein